MTRYDIDAPSSHPFAVMAFVVFALILAAVAHLCGAYMMG